MGDAVNLAFRLETATKEILKDIVISESCYKHIPENIWQGNTQAIKVKGKAEDVNVFAFSHDEIKSMLISI